MTKEQALAAGYVHYASDMRNGVAMHIADLDWENDVMDNEVLTILGTESRHPSISGKEIFELLDEHIYCNCEMEEVDDQVTEAMRNCGVDWEEVANKINKQLESITYYDGLKINLVPCPSVHPDQK